uniref:Putative conserved secreted protein n=1 Tax=Culex tarsalis TaxID=7177 RepID=A0A1Q3FP56_CULTA
MAFFKVCCLVLLATTVSLVVCEEAVAASSSVESAGEQDLEGAETVFLAKKLLLLKGLGLGGLLLLSQKGGSGGFDGLASKFGGSTSVEYGAPAPAYGGYSANYVAAPAPIPAPVATYAPAVPTYTSYAAPAPAPVQVSYQAQAPVADAPVASGYTGNLQVVGYLSPVQSVQAPAPVAYSSQAVSSGYTYSAPAPAPIAGSVQPPCDH